MQNWGGPGGWGGAPAHTSPNRAWAGGRPPPRGPRQFRLDQAFVATEQVVDNLIGAPRLVWEKPLWDAQQTQDPA